MELTIDLKNYEKVDTVFRRTAARGIIANGDQYLLIFSKYGDYKFPGGGMKEGEQLEETLVREVLEETGYHVKKDSIVPYGKVLERRKGEPEDLLEMESYYFFCEVEPETAERNLDDYEAEYDYQVKWTTLQEAISRNQMVTDLYHCPWVVRDKRVMELLEGEKKQENTPKKKRLGRKAEYRNFAILSAVTLLFGIVMHYLLQASGEWNSRYFDLFPTFFVKLFIMPAFYVLLGWLLMQASGIFLGVQRGERLHGLFWVVIGMLLLYVILLLPYAVWLFQTSALQLQAVQEQTDSSFNTEFSVFPAWDYLAYKIEIFNYQNSSMFIVPGILLWITKKDKSKKALS